MSRVVSPPAPPLPALFPALVAIARSGAKQTFAQRSAWIGRSVFLVLILLIFWRLWEAVEAEGRLPALSARELVWYLAVTEWIVIGLPQPHLAMEAEVRSGEIAAVLTRPVPWLAAKLAEALGSMLVRFAALGVTGFAAAYVLSGGWPRDPLALLAVVPLALLAGCFGTLLYALVGLGTFWLGDCTPVAWVVQKLLFLLGGMILPLAFYPAWLADIASWTPFAAMLSGPGRIALGADAAEGLTTASLLVGWTLVLLLLLRWAWGRALRRLDGAGG
jgi:ABC-2 type transport system permease protein